MSIAERPARTRPRLAVVVAGWVAVAACHYLTLPLFGLVSVFGWLVFGACWLVAVVGSLAAVLRLTRSRRYAWAGAVVVFALAAAAAVTAIDWQRAYADSQWRLHRGELADLAARHRAGTLPTAADLPWRLRHLSIDGHAHLRDGALYLPAWEDWRAENGGGFGYFSTPPGPDMWIATAAGDTGRPVRHLGDGWWWVD